MFLNLFVALRRIEDAVFKQPVRFGDTIHVEGKVVRRTPVDDAIGLVLCQWRIVNQHGRLVARVGVEVLWRRAPSPVADAVEPAASGVASP